MSAAIQASERALFVSLPRRAAHATRREVIIPAPTGAHLPTPGRLDVLRRVVTWGIRGAVLAARLAADRLGGRRGPENVGRRVRQMFEEIGGTAVKFGQQLAARVDLLPFEVCLELGKLMDRVPPFGLEHALERISAAAGRPIDAVYRRIEPEPIGSASVACVWRAILHDGDVVAVKVRRPDVALQFSADIRVFALYSRVIEALGLVRPAFFKHLRVELRLMLMEELDFTAEARYHTLYRRGTRVDRTRRWFTAPRIYRALCSDDVVVTAYVDAVAGIELVDAVETRDPDRLGSYAAQDIVPREVGINLLQLSNWGRFENTFFHSDPHPGNILVAPNSTVVMLDFGACGTTSRRAQAANYETIVRLRGYDAQRAAEAANVIVSPLPHIDHATYSRLADAAFYEFMIAMFDPKAAWYERTTAAMWLNFLSAVREYQIPVNLDTLRMVRASLLYDTIVARMHPKTNLAEFDTYTRRQRRRRVRRSRRWLRRELGRLVPRLVGELAATATLLERRRYHQHIRLQYPTWLLQLPSVGRGAWALNRLLTALCVTLGLIVLAGFATYALWGEPATGLTAHLVGTLLHPMSAVLLALAAMWTVRPLIWRLDETGNG